ncbi:hypothetical protein [Marinitoga lauensis]|uniref:hypothetical protein n=1 Tax=Marinitoga lauensis TaxID=2201189 RepID=UPI001012D457|nr:hypothetical protein [Marinitoga lauensis]
MAVRKSLILISLIISFISFGYNIYLYPYDFNLDYNFNEYFEVLIIETESLHEYNLLTGQPYSKAAVYIPDENIIITEPFTILKNLKIFRKTLIHELYHYYLTNFLKMNYQYQEIYIKNLGFNMKRFYILITLLFIIL